MANAIPIFRKQMEEDRELVLMEIRSGLHKIRKKIIKYNTEILLRYSVVNPDYEDYIEAKYACAELQRIIGVIYESNNTEDIE